MINKKHISSLALTLLGACILVLFGTFFLKDVHFFKDIICWDESFYLFTGINIPQKVTKTWGPFYGAWYLILAIWQKVFTEIDLVKLYFLNFKMLTITVPILLFVFLKLKKVTPLAAFFLACGYFISSINLETWPHISHYCFMVLLAGLIISHFFKSYMIKWLIIIVSVFMMTYARPELYLSFLILSAIFIGWLFTKRFKFKTSEWVFFSLAILFIAALHLKMGSSMNSGGESNPEDGHIARDVFAFGQHFVLNYFEWNNINEESWLAWKPYFRENFEIKSGIISTGLSNSSLFFKHVGSNIQNFIYNIFDDISTIILYNKIIGMAFWLKMVICGALITAWLILGEGIKKVYKRIISSEHGFLLLVFFVFAIPSFAASVLIYPRDHYITLQMPFYMSLIAFVFFTEKFIGFKKNAIGMVLIGVFLFAFSPDRSKVDYFDLWQKRQVTYNYNVIQELKTLNFDKCGDVQCKLLENEGGVSFFAENPKIFSFVPIPNRDSLSLEEYFEKYNIQIVFITKSLLKDPIISKFEEWEDLIETPSNFDFERHTYGFKDEYLLIKEGIL